MTKLKLATRSLLLTLALVAAFAPRAQAERQDLEDSDITDGQPPDFRKDFSVDGITYTAVGSLNLNVSEEGNAHVQVAMIDSGSPIDLSVSYIIRCAGIWETVNRISHDYDVLIDEFDVRCHIPGQLVESIIGRFYFGP